MLWIQSRARSLSDAVSSATHGRAREESIQALKTCQVLFEILEWMNALAGTWVDLGPELGGVSFDGRSIIYAFREPVAAHACTRATYTNISEQHFTWRGEKSDDGKEWSEFMVVEVYRTKV